MSNMKISPSRFKAFAIVRDRLGRIVVDESIFHDIAKLEQLRMEVVKNGSYTSRSDS